MREIKFRAWDKRMKKMGSIFSLFWREDGSLMDGSMRDNPNKSIDDFTIMQFTGLLAKNQKEIYEGDIVVTKYKRKILSRSIIEERKGSFVFSTKNQYIEIGRVKDDIAVIGNIYENPELLKFESSN